MIKISVIMPVYNKERYLHKTIESILSQTYKNFELIIINDGSNDKSEEICREYEIKDNRVKLYTIKNSGVSNARNIGISYASGEYIQFIDGDDVINTGTFSEYISILNIKKYDVLFSSYNKVNHDDEILNLVDLGYRNDVVKQDIVDNFAKDQFGTGYYGWISNKLIKRSIIADNRIKFNTNIVLAEDLDFFIDIYKYSNDFYFTNYISFNYLQEADNCSLSKKDEDIDYYVQLNIILKIKRFIAENKGYHGKNKEIIDDRIFNYVFFVVFYSKLEKSNIKNLVKKIIDDEHIINNLHINLKPTFRNIIVTCTIYGKFYYVYLLLKIRSSMKNIAKRLIRG
ncbi:MULTISPECIES: glycosyltransferase family 2 protein [unclassified Romboutsia]|uniref:glycosyltransferase family 2 protein n=1 Tax=unclassified Romboutsia TaxID=2626894 RepID=UPI0008210051|nr:MULTISPECIES: glycosyltransferase family 2 protein [unclassified Romboutsia]SCH20086.1 Spore coat polysaccharide biosynthesis protein spsA [uncultured Clostridium sp.]